MVVVVVVVAHVFSNTAWTVVQVHQWLNELRGIVGEGPKGPEMTLRVRTWFDELRSRYGLRVIGQRPCTKLYSHYVADLARLPLWDTLQHCNEHCSKYAHGLHCAPAVAIPSVCPSLGYVHAGCVAQLHRLSARWLPAAGRPPEMCGLRTRPRTDVHPPRVELPSAGGISSRRPRDYTLFETPRQTDLTRSSAIAEGPRDASCQLKSCQLPCNSAVRQVPNKSKL